MCSSYKSSFRSYLPPYVLSKWCYPWTSCPSQKPPPLYLSLPVSQLPKATGKILSCQIWSVPPQFPLDILSRLEQYHSDSDLFQNALRRIFLKFLWFYILQHEVCTLFHAFQSLPPLLSYFSILICTFLILPS